MARSLSKQGVTTYRGTRVDSTNEDGRNVTNSVAGKQKEATTKEVLGEVSDF